GSCRFRPGSEQFRARSRGRRRPIDRRRRRRGRLHRRGRAGPTRRSGRGSGGHGRLRRRRDGHQDDLAATVTVRSAPQPSRDVNLVTLRWLSPHAHRGSKYPGESMPHTVLANGGDATNVEISYVVVAAALALVALGFAAALVKAVLATGKG